jgi:tetratricopeptide (TPR) repeat protein
MPYIWDRDTLWSLRQHRSKDVQEWAVMRLLELYPEVEADLLRTLPHTSPELASTILSRVRGVACPSEVYTFLQRAPTPFLKARAAALLVRAGHEIPASQLAAVNLSSVLALLADTAFGVDFLVQRYGDTDTEDETLLHALSLACGSTEIMMLLAEASGKKDRRTVLESLGSAWGCDLSDLRDVQQAPEAADILQHTLAVLPDDTSTLVPWQQELLQALAQDRQRLAAIAAAAKIHLSRRSELSPTDTVFLLSCVLALRRDSRCQQLLLEASDVAAVWPAMVLRPWHTDVGPGLVHFFGSQGPLSVLTALRQALARPYAHADFPFAMLHALTIPGRFDLFLEAYQGAYEEQFVDEAEAALRAGGPLAAAALVEHYCRDLPEPIHLFVLASLPTAEVETFLLTHMDHYMGQVWSRYYVEVLELVASERFLEPLLQEWRQGEAIIGQAISLIAAIHGAQPAQLRRIQHDVAEHDREFKRFQARAAKNPARALQGMLEHSRLPALPLRCTVCQRTYHYEVQKVFVNPKRFEEYHLGHIIQCKGCGSIETYELTPATQMALGAEIMRLGLLLEMDKRQGGGSKQAPPETPLILQKPQLTAAGRSFDSIGDAYRFLQEQIAHDPTNGELHRRLGNVLKNGDRPDLALPVYLEAIRVDPHEAEAYYNIVEILLEQKRYREAIPHLETLIHLCREDEMDEELRRDLFASLLEQVTVVERQTGQRLPLFPLPAPAEVSPVAAEHDKQHPPVVYLTSFDLADPNDFERTYHVFRTGRLPDVPRRGLSRWLRGSRPSEDATPPDWPQPLSPVRTAQTKVGRNAPCPCGSGRKYKKCCGQ